MTSITVEDFGSTDLIFACLVCPFRYSFSNSASVILFIVGESCIASVRKIVK